LKLKVEACDGETEEFKMCTTQETPVRMRVNVEYEPTFAESEWETSFTGKTAMYHMKATLLVQVYAVFARYNRKQNSLSYLTK
jgi:hypothetical protein